MSFETETQGPDDRSFPFVCHQTLRKSLAEEGWRTPNTYCNQFGVVENVPGVYLFMVVDNYDYSRCFVGYAGMSVKLLQRLTGHPVKSELDDLGLWVMTWFKLTPAAQLREFERACIRKFNPPWNIIGKVRGVAA